MDSNDMDWGKLHEVNLPLAVEPLLFQQGGGDVPCYLPLWLVDSFFEERWKGRGEPQFGGL